jgi:hypothetical protein
MYTNSIINKFYESNYYIINQLSYIVSIIIITGIIYLLYINKNVLKNIFKLFTKKTLIILIILFFISLTLRTIIVEPKNILYIDEYLFVNKAGNLNDNTVLINEYSSKSWVSKSLGWPFIISIAFRIFGKNNLVPMYLSALFGSMLIFTTFLISVKITKKRHIGIISSSFMAIFPTFIFYSSTADNIIFSLFLFSVVILLWILYLEKPNNNMLWLVLMILAFYSITRLENYLISLIFILHSIYIQFKSNRLHIKNNKFKFILPYLIFGVLILPDFISGFTFSKVSTCSQELIRGINLRVLLSSLDVIMIIISLIILSFFGIRWLYLNNKNNLFVLSSALINTIIITLFLKLNKLPVIFPYSFSYFNLFNRFLLPLLFIILLLTSIGFLIINKRYAIICAILILLLFTTHIVINFDTINNHGLILQTNLKNNIKNDITENSIIISSCPEMLQLTNKFNLISYDQIYNYNLTTLINDIKNNVTEIVDINKINDLENITIYFLEDHCCRMYYYGCPDYPLLNNMELFNSYTNKQITYNVYFYNE